MVALLALSLTALLGAAPDANDVLVYKDGDRIQGRLVSNEGGIIIFRSNHFGELHVPATEAEVVRGGSAIASANNAPQPPANPAVPPAPPSNPTAAPAPLPSQPAPGAVAAGKPPPGGGDAESPEAEQAADRAFAERFADQLRNIFGPWHGRLSFSSQLAASTSSQTQTNVVEGRLERKWPKDQLRFEGRYDFISTDDATSTDLTKGNAYWRHDVSKHWFTIVHPSVEWNAHYIVDDEDADYFLLQHELGLGRTVWDHQGKKLRLGVAENIYQVWELSESGNSISNAESAFVEAEFRLPWNMKVTERGVRYFSFGGGHDGWESQFELSKNFTEKLVVSLKHEIRRNEPDSRIEDYSSWRILFGLDF